jgi:hypothetical protein
MRSRPNTNATRAAGRPNDVTADGEDLVSRAGSALLARIADKTGLTRALSLRAAHASARERAWELGGLPKRLTIDLDATLITLSRVKNLRQLGALKVGGGCGSAPSAAAHMSA